MNSFIHWKNKVPPILYNKYLLTFVLFSLWMIFMDHNKLPTQYGLRLQINEMSQEQDRLRKDIGEVREKVEAISSDIKLQEKVAREKYHMKRPNEDVYTIISSED